MNTSEISNPVMWPLAVFFILTLLLVMFILALSFILGQRHRSRASDEIYECGLISTGSARVRFAAKFYLMAMFFVIFDLEAVFIYTYAVAFRELGWAGYIEIAIFTGVLIAALIYLWRMKALDWGPRRQRINDNR